MSNQEERGAEGICPYSADEAKGKQVEQMFDSIAPAYDFMNTAMTFGLHKLWRRSALRAAFASEGMKRALASEEGPAVLDVATGTGDLAFAISSRLRKGTVTGVDLSEGMLSVARKRMDSLPQDKREMLSFERGDCLSLRFADNSFDLITVAYGVRNFERLADGLREMWRVLRPGGTLCVLELSRPVALLPRLGYDFYSGHLIPAVGRMVSGDSEAYTYLPRSIAAAPQRGALTAMMEDAGFADCTFRGMTLGVVTLYLGRKGEFRV